MIMLLESEVTNTDNRTDYPMVNQERYQDPESSEVSEVLIAFWILLVCHNHHIVFWYMADHG